MANAWRFYERGAPSPTCYIVIPPLHAAGDTMCPKDSFRNGLVAVKFHRHVVKLEDLVDKVEQIGNRDVGFDENPSSTTLPQFGNAFIWATLMLSTALDKWSTICSADRSVEICPDENVVDEQDFERGRRTRSRAVAGSQPPRRGMQALQLRVARLAEQRQHAGPCSTASPPDQQSPLPL